MYDISSKAFSSNREFAYYLASNYKKSIELIENGSLFEIVKKGDINVFIKLNEDTKNYKHPDNILTYLIYILDNSLGIITKNYHFENSNDIAKTMRNEYPKIVEDIKTLFSDPVLTAIYWSEYQKTNDQQYKRQFTFMQHVYENSNYGFTYYYYLFLHLESDDKVRFIIDKKSMTSIPELAKYIEVNQNRSIFVLEEIAKNDFVLALLAKETSIDLVVVSLKQGTPLALLNVFNYKYEYNYFPILKRRMAFWLLTNYSAYTYETKEAKALEAKYIAFNYQETGRINDLIDTYAKANELYQEFVELFNHNGKFNYKKGISGNEDYYLGYQYNDEFVSKKFLVENGLFDASVFNLDYKNNIENEIVKSVLNNKKNEVNNFINSINQLKDGVDLSFKNNTRLLLYGIMLFITVVLALIFSSSVPYSINKLIYLIVGGIATILLVIYIISLIVKLNKADYINDALEKAGNEIKHIDYELGQIENSKMKNEIIETLKDLDASKKNRENDLNTIKKYLSSSLVTKEYILTIVSVFSILPIICGIGDFILLVTNHQVIDLSIAGFNFYFIAYALFDIIIVSIFSRKARFLHYAIYVLLAIALILCYVI